MPINLETEADFTWGYGANFLLTVSPTEHYVWSDPDYDGDNTIRPYLGNPIHFTSPGFAGRSKGRHVIGDYCGNHVVFVGC